MARVALVVLLVLAATARAQPAPDADLHEDAEIGPVILIESIEIAGNTATETEIIRRALPIQPGDILLGLGISVGGGVIYAAHGNVVGSRDQWAGEVRLADGSLRGTRWGVMGSMTLVHGSEPYRVAGAEDDTSVVDFHAFPYRRFGG